MDFPEFFVTVYQTEKHRSPSRFSWAFDPGSPWPSPSPENFGPGARALKVNWASDIVDGAPLVPRGAPARKVGVDM